MKKQEVIDNLKKLASQLGSKKYITLKDIKSVPKLQYFMYFHFKKLKRALREAGLPSSRLASGMDISDESLLGYLKDLRDHLGYPPTVWEIQHDTQFYKKYSDGKITWSIYKSRFGGLTKAKELTGTQMDRAKEYKTRSAEGDLGEGEETLPKNRFWGEAAELHVLAELLYRQFQAANIPVDVGLDILAFKNNKTYYFQVKHKDLCNNQAIKITKSSFKKTGGGEVYYIFVLLSDEKRDFLIIPYHLMNDWIREKIVEETDNGYLIHIRHIKREEKQYILKEKVLDDYLNNWDVIR